MTSNWDEILGRVGQRAHYNSWPDPERWPLRNIAKLTTLDQWEQWFAASHMCERHMRERLGMDYGFRQILAETLPVTVRNAFKFERGRAPMTSWYLYLAGPSMQNAVGHLFMFTNSQRDYNVDKMRYVMRRPALVVELGCNHEWETTRPFRCYTEHRCLKCKEMYSIDSSD